MSNVSACSICGMTTGFIAFFLTLLAFDGGLHRADALVNEIILFECFSLKKKYFQIILDRDE